MKHQKDKTIYLEHMLSIYILDCKLIYWQRNLSQKNFNIYKRSRLHEIGTLSSFKILRKSLNTSVIWDTQLKNLGFKNALNFPIIDD